VDCDRLMMMMNETEVPNSYLTNKLISYMTFRKFLVDINAPILVIIQDTCRYIINVFGTTFHGYHNEMVPNNPLCPVSLRNLYVTDHI
jgi:hypothetical protein